MATARSHYRLLTSYYRPKPGGFCKRYFRAIKGLLSAGCDVHYLAVERFPIDHPRCYFHRFPWPSGRTDSLLFWGTFHLLAPVILFYLAVRYRVTHGFAFGPTYSALLQPTRILLGVPLTLFVRGDILRAHEIKGKKRWIRAIDSIVEGVGLLGVRVYGVSEALVNRVRQRHRWLRPARTDVLRNDIEPPCASPRAGLRGILHVGCVGILEATKNQRFVVALWSQLPRNLGRLRLYGVGPAESELRKLAMACGVSDEVDFMGWAEREEIWSDLDVLLMPSLQEGAPNAVLEAVACGVPVLASDIPEHRELLPEAALLPLVSRAWVDRLLEIAADPQVNCTQQARAQSEYAASFKFDWDERIYEAITERLSC